VKSNPAEPEKQSQPKEPTQAEDQARDQPSEHHRADSVASNEQWMALCARAAVEEDPKKLLELVREINRLLEIRNKRLANSGNFDRNAAQTLRG
jgi:hypothetical protein